jgi:hypothetical protein
MLMHSEIEVKFVNYTLSGRHISTYPYQCSARIMNLTQSLTFQVETFDNLLSN